MAHVMAQFRVLGPVGAWVGEMAVPLGGPRPRAVLAILLLAQGKTVSAQRLVDAVWGEEAPATVTGRVHAIISGLRQALAKAGLGSEVILTAPGGYRLDSAVGALDVAEFQARAAAGSRAAENAQYEVAVRHFQAALAVWTGRALEGLDGLDGSFAVREAERWEDLRLDVVEACAAARLAAPGPPEAGLIHELAGLAAANPQREELVALLMTALHRAGRGSQAVAAFRANQRWLRDELGLDAPKRLAALASAILRDEPGTAPSAATSTTSTTTAATDRSARRPAVSSAPRPAQLPAQVVGFAGRDHEMQRLDTMLATAPPAPPGTAVALIIGPAGAGKTELALHWAHRSAGRFPDGQLFVNLRGHAQGPPLEPAAAISGFLRALGVPAQAVPPDQDEAAALYRSLLADRSMLILLDNAVSPNQVRPLLPGGAGCRVLVTSRHRLGGLIAGNGAGALPLGALEDVEALALMRRIIGDERVEAELEPARRIVVRCGALPLAVRIAATRLVNAPELTLAAFHDSLREAGLLRTLAIEGDEQGGVAAALHLSYQALTGPARRLLALLGLTGFEDFTGGSIAALAGGDHRGSAGELVDAHLLTRAADGRYAMHDLVAEFAVQRSDTELAAEDAGQAADRLLAWYTKAAEAATHVIYPTAPAAPAVLPAEHLEATPRPPAFATHAEALAWLDSESRNLTAAVRLAAGRGLHRAAVELIVQLLSYYDLSKRWDDWIATHEIAARSAAAIADPAAEAWALNYVGVAYEQLNRFEQALERQQRALTLCRQAGDARVEAAVCTSLGVTYSRRGEVREALTYLERSLSLHREHGDADGQTLALNNIAEAHTLLGMYDEALAGLEEALAIASRLGNAFNTRVILCSLGVLHGLAGRYEQAEANLRRAVETGTATRDRYGVAETLACLGDVLHRAGQIDEAHRRWKEAAELFDDIDVQKAAAVRDRTADCCGEHGFAPQKR